MNRGLYRIHAAGIADQHPRAAPPQSVELIAQATAEGPKLLAVNAISSAAHPYAKQDDPAFLDRSHCILTPAFANAHTHLDLTHLGPLTPSPDSRFVNFAGAVRAGRATTAAGIAAAVAEGIRLSLAGGVAAVGDIAGVGRLAAYHTLRDSPLRGVSYIEFFGAGLRAAAAARAMAELVNEHPPQAQDRVRLGVSPHAAYSAGIALYEAAAKLHNAAAIPITTHLAESLEERIFIAQGDGPFRDLLQSLGVWDDAITATLGAASPIAHLAPILQAAPMLLAHINDCSDADIEILAAAGRRHKSSIAYCPRASRWFGYSDSLGPHRYRELLAAGINVCLATDSILNLPAAQADRLSPLDDARLLFQEDSAEPHLLLSMITTRPAAALGLDRSQFAFPTAFGRCSRQLAGIAAIPITPSADASAAEQVMRSSALPELLPL